MAHNAVGDANQLTNTNAVYILKDGIILGTAFQSTWHVPPAFAINCTDV